MALFKSDLVKTAAREQVYAEGDAFERGSKLNVRTAGTSSSILNRKDVVQRRKEKPAVKKEEILNPMATEWSPNSNPLLVKQKYLPKDIGDVAILPASNKETLQRVIQVQEKQAKYIHFYGNTSDNRTSHVMVKIQNLADWSESQSPLSATPSMNM